jgi:hypothetical protein
MKFSQFQLTYELCPIILQDGIAANMPGGQLPVISITQSGGFSTGPLGSSDDLDFDDYIAHFTPLPGSTLVENQVGMYPFANQQVAANAIIVQPLKISLLMTAPVKGEGGYPLKLASFTDLQQQVTRHNILGGTYTVATPAMYYFNLLLLGIHDASTEDTRQVQVKWQWDFIKPLLTEADATQAYSSMMYKLQNRNQLTGDPPSYSGTANAVGSSPSGVGAALVPAGQQAGASSVGVGQQPISTLITT